MEKWKEKTRAELIKPCHSHDGLRHWKFVVDFGRACCTHDFFFDYVVLTENWEWVLSLEYTQSIFIRNDVSIQSISVLSQRRSHECNLLFQNPQTILSVSIHHGSGISWIQMSHWCHTMVDGAKLWISCQRLRILRKAGERACYTDYGHPMKA